MMPTGRLNPQHIRKLKADGELERLLEVQAQASQAKDERLEQQAAKAVVQLAKRDTQPLIAVMVDPYEDEEIKAAAAEALGKLAASEAVDALIAALNNKQLQEGTRQTMINALSHINDPRVMAALVQVLGDRGGSESGGHVDTGVVRNEAVRILLSQGKAAIPYLVDALGEADPFHRGEIVKLLDKLRWKPRDQNANAAAYWIEHKNHAQVLAIGEAAIEPLMIELINPSEKLRAQAAETLGKIGPSVLKPLVLALLEKRYYDLSEDRQNFQAGIEQALVTLGPVVLKPIMNVYDKYDFDVFGRGVLARVVLKFTPPQQLASMEMFRIAAQYR